jgi:hypothetical protein
LHLLCWFAVLVVLGVWVAEGLTLMTYGRAGSCTSLQPAVPFHAGTPLQNDALELLNLLRFLQPSLFGGGGGDGGDCGGDDDDGGAADEDVDELLAQVGADPQVWAVRHGASVLWIGGGGRAAQATPDVLLSHYCG